MLEALIVLHQLNLREYTDIREKRLDKINYLHLTLYSKPLSFVREIRILN